jgi:diketogulonate reductase-like aldo/keto reductase
MFGVGFRRAESEDATIALVETALEAGCRLLDTASIYENETAIGHGLRNSMVPRADLFISTKVWTSDQGYERTIEAFNRSLDNLDLEYLDLYLLHWPMIRLRTESWRALEHLSQSGRCRTIGVCNFTVRHMTEILRDGRIVPAVNEVEFNPYLNQAHLQSWCRDREIQLVSSSPLARGKRLNDPRLRQIAGNYGKTPTQVLLRWSIQKGVVTLLRASAPEDVADNARVFDFEISPGDMGVLNGFHENLRSGWDPTKAP